MGWVVVVSGSLAPGCGPLAAGPPLERLSVYRPPILPSVFYGYPTGAPPGRVRWQTLLRRLELIG